MKSFRYVILLLVICLSACSSLPASQGPLNQNLTWPQRQAQLNAIQNWTVRGTIGGHTAEQTFSASVVWQQNARQFDMHLFGPLGAGMTQLSGNMHHVTLLNSNNQSIQANNPESLLQQELGWSLPVSNLYYWIRGLPAPNSAKQISFDRYHHIIKLEQQGWSIQYLGYSGIDGQVDLPNKIVMQRGDLDLRLIIKQWQL